MQGRAGAVAINCMVNDGGDKTNDGKERRNDAAPTNRTTTIMTTQGNRAGVTPALAL